MVKLLSKSTKKKLKRIFAKKFFVSFLVFLSAATLTVLVILFAQGYHFSRETGKIEKTGLLVLTSTPNGAPIFVNNHLTDATNTTIKLVPGSYQVRVEKEGYLPWQKELKVAEGLVTAADATLFPALPTLRPLTFFGVQSPTLSPDGSKIAFLTDAPEKAGVWILNLSTQTLAFIRNDLYQIVADTPQQRFSEGKISWSPNSRHFLISFEREDSQSQAKSEPEPKTVFLLDPNVTADKQKPSDITLSLNLYQETWASEKRKKEEGLVSLLPEYLQKIATDSATSRWSSDEEKFLYQEEEVAKVYDPQWEEFPPQSETKPTEDRKGKVFELPKALDYIWLPEAKSNHLILVEKQQISIIEAEGTNKAIIFGGEFEENFVAPWPDGSKLVILTSLNKTAGTPPNLYTINLR